MKVWVTWRTNRDILYKVDTEDINEAEKLIGLGHGEVLDEDNTLMNAEIIHIEEEEEEEDKNTKEGKVDARKC